MLAVPHHRDAITKGENLIQPVAHIYNADPSVAQFAQALRAIGEPIMDRPANEISMAQLLGQLFQYTEVFDMQTRPELLLLQKTMVVVEGVGRSLDPALNMWVVSDPVVREWMEQQLGAGARMEAAAEGAATVTRFVGEIPKFLGQAERTADAAPAPLVVVNVQPAEPAAYSLPLYPVWTGSIVGPYRYPNRIGFLGYGSGTASPGWFSGLGLNPGNNYGHRKEDKPNTTGFGAFFGPPSH